MKLDATILRYITKDEIRVLTAIEMGMKNHEVVPVQLIESIAKLKRGGTFKIIQGLLKYKLIQHLNKQYSGYSLTYQGYDTLAIHTFMKRGHIREIGSMIGTGKESDIYLCVDNDGNEIVLKLARLGRISFRQVKNKRDYLNGRSRHNWLYLSRLGAIKEFTFMEALHGAGLPVPSPISQNRHAILMSLLPATTLLNVKRMERPQKVLNEAIDIAIRIARLGLVHSDFNQFNILASEDEKIYVIDFPQMVSRNHKNANEFWMRDLECLNSYFSRRFEVECAEFPKLEDIEIERNLDEEIKASGYVKQGLNKKEIEDLEQLNLVNLKEDANLEENEEEEGEEEENEEGLENNEENKENSEESLSEEEEEESKPEEDENKSNEEKESQTIEKEQKEPEETESQTAVKEENKPGETEIEKEAERSEKLPTQDQIKYKIKKQLSKQNKVKLHQNKVKGAISMKEF
ncbi:unnamed protein product [Blepharisma stoltei]|uniref:Serine/threonine-protein kinase RIO2 n=1 Tax=Blepharisma stoltei TaxID=1481888 RepID=A0AAU9IHV5_9CILI|nr:unnamed protein product [Blepharisma stoltei]